MKVYDRYGLRKVNAPIQATQITKGAQWQSNTLFQITFPTNDVDVIIPYNCTLQEVQVLTAGGAGSCAIALWKAAFASFPPTAANDITAGANVVLTGVPTLDITNLAGWITSFAAGDVLRLRLLSSSTFTRITIQLRLQ